LFGTMTILNSTIEGNNMDVVAGDDGPGYIDLFNTSIETSQIGYTGSTINSSFFLDTLAKRQSDMSFLDNATVQVFDTFNKMVYQGKTDVGGGVHNIPIKWQQMTTLGKTTFSPHRILVNKGNATTNATGIIMDRNQQIQIIIDDVPPALNITYPPEGLVTNQTQIWVCGTTDADARITVDGFTVRNDNGRFNVSYWLDEGNNTISVVAWDDSGNNAGVTRNVTCLTSPPMLQITEPSEMAVLNENMVMVRGNTNGTRLEIDGNPVPVLNSGDFSYSWNVLGEGKRTITAQAWDIAGNSRVVRRTIVFDITPPQIEVLSPQNGSWLRYDSVEVQVRSPDAAGLKAGGLSVDPDSTGLAVFKTSLKEGENRIPISAWDIAGNDNKTVLVLYLDTNIFLDVMEPLGDVLVNHTQVVIRGRTEAGATVIVNGTTAENRGGDFESILRLPDGKNRITVSSTDRAGNNIVRTLMIEVDTVPPAIEVLSPTEASLKVKDIRLRIRSEAGANVTVNGRGATIEAGDIFFMDAVLVQGDNLFTIRSVDGAGNVAAKEYSVAYGPPKPPVYHDGVSGMEPILILVVILLFVVALAGVVIMQRKKKRGS